jgi:hypothetical protein
MATIMDDIAQILGGQGIGIGTYGQGGLYAAQPVTTNTYGGVGSSQYGPELGPGSGSIYEPYTAMGRPQRFLGISPTSGRVTWFGPLGHPLLWSGDRAAAKRWNRFGHRRSRRGGR